MKGILYEVQITGNFFFHIRKVCLHRENVAKFKCFRNFVVQTVHL
jgi:hypothetical protein